jgi:hypothetical protein
MIRRIVVGITLAAIWSSASAEFVILDTSAPPVALAKVAPVFATSNSAPPRAVRNDRENFSTLRDTLRKAVPSQWKAFIDKGLPIDTPVEYIPASDWRQSLAALSTRYNLVFKIDSAKKSVYVDQGPGGMRDTAVDNKGLVQDTFGQEALPAAMTTDGRLRIEVRDGQLLSDALRQFLKSGRWDLAWEAGSDIRIDKGFVEAGSDIGALLTKILSQFNLHATLHKANNVVVVRSNTITD